MKQLGRSKASANVVWNYLFLLSLVSLCWIDGKRDVGIAQSKTSVAPSSPTCQQLTNQRYAVILDRPLIEFTKLPDFLAATAIACNYLNSPMTFFGSFEKLESSLLRAKQLKQIGLDASIHSFNDKQHNDSQQFRSSAVLVELPINPHLALQQVKVLTGKPAFLATFNNRSVILASPLASQQSASRIAYQLRNQGFVTQLISANWINDRTSSLIAKNDKQSAKSLAYFPKHTYKRRKPQLVSRLLIPSDYRSQGRQVYQDFPDAFPRMFSGSSYLQVRSYLDLQNARREKERLSANFSGIVLEAERVYD